MDWWGLGAVAVEGAAQGPAGGTTAELAFAVEEAARVKREEDARVQNRGATN